MDRLIWHAPPKQEEKRWCHVGSNVASKKNIKMPFFPDVLPLLSGHDENQGETLKRSAAVSSRFQGRIRSNNNGTLMILLLLMDEE